VGGQLNIWSNTGAGTEVDFKIPAKVAYARKPGVSRWRWIKPGARGGSGE